MLIKLNASNFFHYFILSPNSKKLSSQDRKIACFASVMLGIFSLGIAPLLIKIFLYDKSFVKQEAHELPKVSEQGKKHLFKDKEEISNHHSTSNNVSISSIQQVKKSVNEGVNAHDIAEFSPQPLLLGAKKYSTITRDEKPFLVFQNNHDGMLFSREIVEALPSCYIYLVIHHTARFETVNLNPEVLEKLKEQFPDKKIVLIAATPGNFTTDSAAPPTLSDKITPVVTFWFHSRPHSKFPSVSISSLSQEESFNAHQNRENLEKFKNVPIVKEDMQKYVPVYKKGDRIATLPVQENNESIDSKKIAAKEQEQIAGKSYEVIKKNGETLLVLQNRVENIKISKEIVEKLPSSHVYLVVHHTARLESANLDKNLLEAIKKQFPNRNIAIIAVTPGDANSSPGALFKLSDDPTQILTLWYRTHSQPNLPTVFLTPIEEVESLNATTNQNHLDDFLNRIKT